MRAIRGAIAVLCVLMGMSAMAETVLIATASNFKPTLDKLKRDFERTSEHHVRISTGSTGKIYAQIKRGAPFDVFLSADDIRPRQLLEEGYAQAGAHFTYAIGRLVVWAPRHETVSDATIKDEAIRHIALANPLLAPYGQAAMDVVVFLGARESLDEKRVEGENIGQTFAFVRSGNADMGFVALSQILQQGDIPAGQYWLVPEDMHASIRQDAILLNHGKENQAAIEFLRYLESEAAQQIIANAGYEVE